MPNSLSCPGSNGSIIGWTEQLLLYISGTGSLLILICLKKRLSEKQGLLTKLKNLDYKITFSDYNQVNMLVNGVKITFFSFPHKVPVTASLDNFLKIPDLLTLSAMKAFALGRRVKWKDYVDLYFIIRYHYTIKEISEKAQEIFKDEFIKKQFLAQLGYFKGINYDEEVSYLIPAPPANEEVEEFLINISIKGLLD